MTAPAGWHPDPDVAGQERYWSGRKWLADVRPAQDTEATPPPSADVLPAFPAGKPSLKERTAAAREKLEVAKAQQVAKHAERAGVDTTGALFTGISHDPGRNASVSLFPDRIERVKAKSLASLSKAHQDVEMTPMRSVTSVQAKKDNLMWTKVTVYASGNTIEFRMAHAEATRFRDLISQQLLKGPEPTIVQQAAAPIDIADQLGKLAALRDQGILSEDEFAAQKAKLLA